MTVYPSDFFRKSRHRESLRLRHPFHIVDKDLVRFVTRLNQSSIFLGMRMHDPVAESDELPEECDNALVSVGGVR
ncbi:hypothetical protein BMS3Bbin12_00281 [bacterium BMS3Bbin12]|nr:hypothetical protein BMS3Bbin12_00281 [bacterium BMS3Bbin12]GBE51382.1 hypothetical protein BMS3Bbin13_02340 [bacterium BMS3Bbin13]